MPDQIPPDDSWPTPEDETLVARHETLVGGAPPPPVEPVPVAPPPGPPPADRRIGAGMLLGLGVLVLVAAGILIAYLLTHRSKDHKSTTVVVTNAAPSTTVAPKVAVPRFVGMKEQDALVRAGQVGVQPKEIFKPTKAPKGTVISQRPQEGTELARGGTVTLACEPEKGAQARNRVITAVRVGALNKQ